MKAQLGKPTGLALALLATLLATFLAMGVFSVAQANEHSATRSFSATTVAPGAEITVTIALSAYGDGGSVAETLPQGFSLVSGSVELVGGGGFVRPSGNQVRIVLAGEGVTSVSYKVTAPSSAGGPHGFSGNFVNFDGESEAVGGMSMVTVAEDDTGTTDPTVQPKATTRTTPGSNQSLSLEADVDFTSTDSITVNLKDFGVPSSIAPAQISIDVGEGDAESTTGTGANPSDVEVDGTKVTLVGPYETGGNNPVNLAAQGTSITKIVFRRAAGITLPIRDGDYDIKVSTSSTPEDEGDGRENLVEVRREITVSPTSGTRGTEVTISGKGFADGTADIMIGDDYTINADVDDGAFTVTVDSAVRNNAGNSVFDGSVSLESGDMDATG